MNGRRGSSARVVRRAGPAGVVVALLLAVSAPPAVGASCATVVSKDYPFGVRAVRVSCAKATSIARRAYRRYLTTGRDPKVDGFRCRSIDRPYVPYKTFMVCERGSRTVRLLYPPAATSSLS